jgi:hypothetical protein
MGYSASDQRDSYHHRSYQRGAPPRVSRASS